jgi:ankyrin repeat protein
MDALHVACRSGSVKMAFLLLSAGAYVDSADGGGETPLHWCLKVLITVLSCTVQLQSLTLSLFLSLALLSYLSVLYVIFLLCQSECI